MRVLHHYAFNFDSVHLLLFTLLLLRTMQFTHCHSNRSTLLDIAHSTFMWGYSALPLCTTFLCLKLDYFWWWLKPQIHKPRGMNFTFTLHKHLSHVTRQNRYDAHIPTWMCIPYNQKYWQSLDLALWPQTERKKIIAEILIWLWHLSSVLHPHKHCMLVYQRVLSSSRLRYLNKAVNLQICKKQNWQSASAELATFTTWEEGTLERTKSTTACITSIIIYCEQKRCWQILIWLFQPRPPNLIPHQLFQLCGMWTDTRQIFS